ncbi:hypothetical protein M378DRAFT_9708 [Amanita muscaria Koide BX008]|uniref:Uncharacterized protein n=1 Tax=Amanita muscaria (strain Koide BX008) TaxID=946122 RepID=A0A0C2XCE3_AMAMK|nr:hypothetical protein M378DRAFT_9708 [Amanita muscaria Koide BX008]
MLVQPAVHKYHASTWSIASSTQSLKVSTSFASSAMTSGHSSSYDAMFLFDDDAREGGEPPRKIITDYAALEAALEKDSRESENGGFPVNQTEKQQNTFWSPIQSGCWDNPYIVPGEGQMFNSLPPPPRPPRRFKKE